MTEEENKMRTTLLKKLLSLSLALTLLLGCASYALAWEPQWAHDEDLSDYKLCENFGDITLKVAVTDHATISTWEENAFVKWLEEVTNVDLTFELIPYEGRAEKLGLILNSGNYPDVFLSCGMTSAMISRFGVDEKMFLPLNDLIEEHGTFTKKMFAEFPGTEGLISQLDGNIYSLPTGDADVKNQIQTEMWLNQAWMEKLNLNMEAVLEQIRLANQQRFGRKTEKLDQITGQLYLFNEVEEAADLRVGEPSAEEVITGRKKKQKGKREEDVKDLPRETHEYKLTDEELDAFYTRFLNEYCLRYIRQH